MIFLSGIVVEEGKNETLNCSLTGSPINWTSPLNESRNGQYFHISNFTCNKVGIYTCRNASSKEEHNVTSKCKYFFSLEFFWIAAGWWLKCHKLAYLTMKNSNFACFVWLVQLFSFLYILLLFLSFPQHEMTCFTVVP